MLEWMIMPLKRYADFNGRSRRKEFWSFFLLNMIVVTVVMSLVFSTGGMARLAEAGQAGAGVLAVYGAMFSGVGVLLAVWWLATIVPNVAVAIRRLHDRDMSGWWYPGFIVLGLIPFIGFIATIAMLVVFCLEGTPGPNRFGPDPKGPAHQDVFA